VPAAINQKVTDALTKADIYISSYNIYAGNLLSSENKPVFPHDMVLLSHWNLREEIKSV
jgi:hypothetical protein